MQCNIKITGIILFTLIIQTSASFFDEYEEAISNVEDKFGKLFSDVISDVKEKIDCTLLAVAKVLSFGENSDYDTRCKDKTEETAPIIDSNRDNTYEIPKIKTFHQITEEKNIAAKISQDIQTSILNVNKTRCKIFDKEDAQVHLKNVKTLLNNETERLTEVSQLLGKELNNITKYLKDKLTYINSQKERPSLESVTNDIKILRDIQQKNKSSPEAKEISYVFDKVLNILDTNKTMHTISTDGNKIQEIIRNLKSYSKETVLERKNENQPGNWKVGKPLHEPLFNFSVIKNGQEIKAETKEKVSHIITELPITFKDVAKKIFVDLTTPAPILNFNKLYDAIKSSTESVVKSGSLNGYPTTDRTTKKKTDSLDYDSLYDLEHRKALIEIKNIVKNSKYSKLIMKKYFKMKGIADVFD